MFTHQYTSVYFSILDTYVHLYMLYIVAVHMVCAVVHLTIDRDTDRERVLRKTQTYFELRWIREGT